MGRVCQVLMLGCALVGGSAFAGDDAILAAMRGRNLDALDAALRQASCVNLDLAELASRLNGASQADAFVGRGMLLIQDKKAVCAGEAETTLLEACVQQHSESCVDRYVKEHPSATNKLFAAEALVSFYEERGATLDEYIRLYEQHPFARKLFPREAGFWVSGPSGVEAYVLKNLKIKGVSDFDLIQLVLNAKGEYPKQTDWSDARWEQAGIRGKLLEAIAHKPILDMGTLKIRSVVSASNRNVPEVQIIHSVLNGSGYRRLSDAEGRWLKSLGVSAAVVDVISFHRLLSKGPDEYRVYHVVRDVRAGKSHAAISSAIKGQAGGYKSFSDPELDDLTRWGVAPILVSAMEERTQELARLSQEDVDANYRKLNANVPKTQEYHTKSSVVLVDAPGNIVLNSGRTQADNGVGSVLKTAASCFAANKVDTVCDRAPFPANLVCKALAKNALDC